MHPRYLTAVLTKSSTWFAQWIIQKVYSAKLLRLDWLWPKMSKWWAGIVIFKLEDLGKKLVRRTNSLSTENLPYYPSLEEDCTPKNFPESRMTTSATFQEKFRSTLRDSIHSLVLQCKLKWFPKIQATFSKIMTWVFSTSSSSALKIKATLMYKEFQSLMELACTKGSSSITIKRVAITSTFQVVLGIE